MFIIDWEQKKCLKKIFFLFCGFPNNVYLILQCQCFTFSAAKSGLFSLIIGFFWCAFHRRIYIFVLMLKRAREEDNEEKKGEKEGTIRKDVFFTNCKQFRNLGR